MVCKHCHMNLPDPEPVIKKVEVVADPALYLAKWLAIVILFGTLCITVGCMYSDYTLSKAVDNPTMKIEINEYDANGRPSRKISR